MSPPQQKQAENRCHNDITNANPRHAYSGCPRNATHFVYKKNTTLQSALNSTVVIRVVSRYRHQCGAPCAGPCSTRYMFLIRNRLQPNEELRSGSNHRANDRSGFNFAERRLRKVTSNPGKSRSSRICFERPRGWGSRPS